MAKEVLITNDGFYLDGKKINDLVSYTIKENSEIKVLVLELTIEDTLLVQRGHVKTTKEQK